MEKVMTIEELEREKELWGLDLPEYLIYRHHTPGAVDTYLHNSPKAKFINDESGTGWIVSIQDHAMPERQWLKYDLWTEFLPERRKSIGEYYFGKKEGYWKTVFADGIIESEGEYHNDKKVPGTWWSREPYIEELFDINGRKIGKIPHRGPLKKEIIEKELYIENLFDINDRMIRKYHTEDY